MSAVLGDFGCAGSGAVFALGGPHRAFLGFPASSRGEFDCPGGSCRVWGHLERFGGSLRGLGGSWVVWGFLQDLGGSLRGFGGLLQGFVGFLERFGGCLRGLGAPAGFGGSSKVWGHLESFGWPLVVSGGLGLSLGDHFSGWSLGVLGRLGVLWDPLFALGGLWGWVWESLVGFGALWGRQPPEFWGDPFPAPPDRGQDRRGRGAAGAQQQPRAPRVRGLRGAETAAGGWR